MMNKISEKSVFPNFNLQKEYAKLESLLSDRKIISGEFDREYRSEILTAEEYLNENFLKWHLRGSCLSLLEFREGFGIAKEQLSQSEYLNKKTALEFIQYACNCLYFIERGVST